MSNQLNLTGIFLEDPEYGGFTAYIEEFPEAIAEGDSIEEAEENLLQAFKFILEVKRELAEESTHGPNTAIRKQIFA